MHGYTNVKFVDRFAKTNQKSNFMKIRTVGAELFPAAGSTDRWTDRHDTAMNVLINGITIITKSLTLFMKEIQLTIK